MQFGKLIDGNLALAPCSIKVGDRQIGNPPAEILLAEGWLPVIYTDPPEPEPGFVAISHWEETEVMGDAVIAQIWVVEPEPDEISEERAYRIITGKEE